MVKTSLLNKIKAAPGQLLTYAEWMEIVLYDEDDGYYTVDREKIGRQGDFITTSNIGSIYGEVLAHWYAQLVDKYHLRPAICEIGAGNGRFAQAFIRAWSNYSAEKLTYYMIETSPYHRKLQEKLLPIGDTVFHVSSLEAIAPFSGLVFSNELYDALPVHVIHKKQGQLFEKMIGFREGKFIEKSVPLTNEAIVSFLQTYDYKLNEGQTIEIPLAMLKFIPRVAAAVETGLVLTVDYGYEKAEWMQPGVRDGSLRGYFKQELMKDVLQHMGEMDITSHVHLDVFIAAGAWNGLAFVMKQRQDEFFLRAGILNKLIDHQSSDPFSEVNRKNRAIRQLIMSGMSDSFHVIVQQKGLTLTKEELFI